MNASPLFTVTASCIQGLGWFATRDIAESTYILEEDAAFSVPMAALDDPNRINQKLADLKQQDREAFLALSGVGESDKLYMNGIPLTDMVADPLGIGMGHCQE